MSNGNFPRRTLDDAIDRAVRELMTIDPRPGLRRRVLSRLERRAGGASAAARLLVPAAALLAIVVAVMLWDPAGAPTPSPASDSQTASAPPPVERATSPKPAAPQPIPEAPSRAANASPRSESIFGPRTGRVTATAVPAATAREALPVDATEETLVPFAPITMTPLPAINEIRVSPLEIQRITIPALPPRRQ